ncbi:Uncharacterised protein [uncultured archaeon]|nr:Uncharacterised protein [uncultured archaeon]
MSEISGIIKNGMQRGWQPKEIYQSLLNSGYNPQEIQSEINKLSAVAQPVQQVSSQGNGQKLAPYQIPVPQEKKSAGKGLIIALVILAIIVVLGGASFILFGPK